MKKFILIMSFAAAVFTALEVSAKTVDLGFRIGKAVAAEITSAPLEIINLDQYPNPLPAKRLYAVAVLKMASNRSLSSLDYSLVVNSITVPCVAVVSNMASFVCSPDAIYPAEKDYARLLFVLDAGKVKLPAPGKTLRCTLKTNIRGRSNAVLNFSSLGSKPFSDCKNIPAAGSLK